MEKTIVIKIDTIENQVQLMHTNNMNTNEVLNWIVSGLISFIHQKTPSDQRDNLFLDIWEKIKDESSAQPKSVFLKLFSK